MRRRGIAAALLGALAAGAFAFGAALGDGAPAPPGAASRLGLAQLVGERLVVGFTGTEVPAGVRRMVRAGELAGVVLFAENLPSRAAGKRLIAELQGIPRPPLLRRPLLIMVDQEGGQVKRLSGAPTVSAREMGARGAAFSAGQGRRAAANLRNVGVNLDLAPVLDVGRPGGVIAATERSFGASAPRVTAAAVPFAKALQAGGVAATGKHFPGFGAARENTDFSVERVTLSREELRSVDEKPYRAFAAAGGKVVMLSTAIYPAFSQEPAAFTRAIATGELRDRLGFAGVTITDALETPAVAHFGDPAEAAVAGARAGTDLLLFTRLDHARVAARALLRGLRSGALGRDEFEAAVERVLELRAQAPR